MDFCHCWLLEKQFELRVANAGTKNYAGFLKTKRVLRGEFKTVVAPLAM